MKLFVCMFICMLFSVELVFGQTTMKKFHLITSARVTWHKALHYCNARGWRLAAVTSKQENDQILKQIEESGIRDNFWLGGTNLFNEPYFFWMGSDAPFTFTDWLEGEPNNALLNEKCLETRYSKEVYKWNDSQCSRKVYFICEERISVLPGGESFHFSLSDRIGSE